MKEIIGITSGIIVIISGVPYIVRTYQNKIHPNPTSWILWSFIGLTLLLTYRSSGAGENVWPAIFGFINPLIVTLILIRNREQWKKFELFEKFCLAFGLISLGMWVYIYACDNQDLAQYALYVAIVADACAAIPTIGFVWRFPDQDRPFAWVLFSIGYGIAVFAVPEHTVANYILPLYMFSGAFFIASPLILYRMKQNIPLKEWI